MLPLFGSIEDKTGWSRSSSPGTAETVSPMDLVATLRFPPAGSGGVAQNIAESDCHATYVQALPSKEAVNVAGIAPKFWPNIVMLLLARGGMLTCER